MARSPGTPPSPIDRRAVLAGLGASALAPVQPARGQPIHLLQAKPDILRLGAGQQDTPIWSLVWPSGGPDVRFRRGQTVHVAFANDLPVPIAPSWLGLDGARAIEPLTAHQALAAGAKESFEIPLSRAGTLLCDPGLLAEGQTRPMRGLPLIVAETEAVGVDRDEVLLIERWQLRADGTAVAPGSEPKDTLPVYAINGQPSLEITARRHERLRFRVINFCQRTIIAVKFVNDGSRFNDLWVMALDGQPAEPFLARNGALVLAPGGRVDVFLDVAGAAGTTSSILLHDGKQTHPIGRIVIANEPSVRAAPLPMAPPLPSNGLPAQLDLKTALRIDVWLGGTSVDWAIPLRFSATSAPLFRVEAGRVVVLALINRAGVANVFHLHGHHFRLLDRLDDGWKPFWLDTLAIESGTTQRIAFAAEHPGTWLIESVATGWSAPRLLCWYSVT